MSCFIRIRARARRPHRATPWKAGVSYGPIWSRRAFASRGSSSTSSLTLVRYPCKRPCAEGRGAIRSRARPRLRVQRFDELDASLAALHAGCTGVRQHLEATESRTAQFVARAEELRQQVPCMRGWGCARELLMLPPLPSPLQRVRVEGRASAVSAFLSRYQLSPGEVEALYTAPLEGDEGKSFFLALARVDAIRGECSALIASPLHAQGIEILEDMAKHQVCGCDGVVFRLLQNECVCVCAQEAVYERLLGWVQAQCAKLSAADDGEEGDVQPLLRHSLRVLLARPAYYRCVFPCCCCYCPQCLVASVPVSLAFPFCCCRHCQDCVASTRRSGLVRRFITALTKGGPRWCWIGCSTASSGR